MTRDQFINWAESQGYRFDDQGHLLKKLPNGVLMRFRIIRGIVHQETRYNEELNLWQSVSRGKLSGLSISKNNLLIGLTTTIKETNS